MRLKLVPLLPTNVVQAKAEDYFPESTRATKDTWPYYRYRETAGKLKRVVAFKAILTSNSYKLSSSLITESILLPHRILLEG